jgi:hypothetical protein
VEGGGGRTEPVRGQSIVPGGPAAARPSTARPVARDTFGPWRPRAALALARTAVYSLVDGPHRSAPGAPGPGRALTPTATSTVAST